MNPPPPHTTTFLFFIMQYQIRDYEFAPTILMPTPIPIAHPLVRAIRDLKHLIAAAQDRPAITIPMRSKYKLPRIAVKLTSVIQSRSIMRSQAVEIQTNRSRITFGVISSLRVDMRMAASR